MLDHSEAVAKSTKILERISLFPQGDIRFGVLEQAIEELRPKYSRNKKQWNYDFKAHLIDEYESFRDIHSIKDAWILAQHYTFMRAIYNDIPEQLVRPNGF